jgi:anti-sigma B factor antagonist
VDLELSTRTLDDYVVAELRGELDFNSAPALEEGLLAILAQRGTRIILDLSDLAFMDAAGLRVILATGRRAALLGGTLSLAAPQQIVARILQVTDLDQRFAIFPTVQEAAASHQAPAHTTLPGAPASGAAHVRRIADQPTARDRHRNPHSTHGFFRTG